ncbi:MAG: UDP-N-acetylmuramate dehydrogenase [Candidatus Midichloriaceae bacterium]|jgi:UDP-N-acetylmuramate dehydrogenase
MSVLTNLPKIKGKYRENTDIGKMCWFDTSTKVEALFIPKDIEDLVVFLSQKPKELQIYIMGVGSNLLIRDGGIKGVMIRLGAGFNYIKHENNQIIAGAATLDINVANYAANNSISGFEFLSGIPGCIGGALAMNAGSYNSDTSSILIEAKAINIHTAEKRIFKKDEIGYSYRSKSLSSDWLFYEAIFQGEFGNKDEIINSIKDIQTKRESTQPIKSKTGGSTFKNPLPHKAWKLIDECGLRGMKIGGAKFSEQHCNFLVNEGHAKASDIEELIILAKQKVKEKFSIDLEEEIKIIGDN